jgi:hypothetical protein
VYCPVAGNRYSLLDRIAAAGFAINGMKTF